MSNALINAIAEGINNQSPIIWLDAEEFAVKVMHNNQNLPWCSPTEFVSSYMQLQSLLKPDVSPVNIGSYLKSWLTENPSAKTEMSGKKRIRYAIKRLLGMDAPRHLIREIVSALCDSLSTPLVLVLPPNSELINWANQQANGIEPVALSDIDIDSVSVYVADFLRTFNGLGVAGVLVELPDDICIDSALLDLYSPIINVAKHYNWVLGFKSNGDVTVEAVLDNSQLILGDFPQSDAAVLDEQFWKDGIFNAEGKKLFHGSVSASLEPETILIRLARLRHDND